MPWWVSSPGLSKALRGRTPAVNPAPIDAGQAMSVLDLLDHPSLHGRIYGGVLTEQNHRIVFDKLLTCGFRRPHRVCGPPRSSCLTTSRARSTWRRPDMIADLLADDDAKTGRSTPSCTCRWHRSSTSSAGTSRPAGGVLGISGDVGGESASHYIAKIAAAMDSGNDGGAGARTADTSRAAARARCGRTAGGHRIETQRRMAMRSGRDVADYAVPAPAGEHPLPVGRGTRTADLAHHRTAGPAARADRNSDLRRRRSLRGQVDVRKTLRASMSTGGAHRPDPPQTCGHRPELVIICDVSGSTVAGLQFTLRLVYALRQQFSKVRVFAFVDTVDEVTEYFDEHTDDDFGAAMHQMISEARISTSTGHSDYGNMLRGFAAMRRIDPPGCAADPRRCPQQLPDARIDALSELVDRVRNSYWLNPEARSVWGTGDR